MDNLEKKRRFHTLPAKSALFAALASETECLFLAETAEIGIQKVVSCLVWVSPENNVKGLHGDQSDQRCECGWLSVSALAL